MTGIETGASSARACILHMSLSGVQSHQHTLGDAQTAGMIGRCMSQIDDLVKMYGGKVDKFIGESAIAIFKSGRGEQPESVNALRAISEIQRVISYWHECEDLPSSIQLKAGIVSGTVYCGSITTASGTQENHFGEAMHLASQICAAASPGQVLAGEETWHETKAHFRYQVMEPLPIKGYREHIPLYEWILRAEKPASADIPGGRIIQSLMIGRERESAMVEDMLKQLLNGRGAVLLIEGEAGVGKSRLMAEVRQGEMIRQLTLLEGRALSEGKNMSFHPIIQILKAWAGIADADKPEAAFRKLSLYIRRSTGEQAMEIIPFIATMMGLPISQVDKERLSGIKKEALERLILKNTRDLVSQATGSRPVLIMIEDAHWADQSTIVFMESLLKLVKTQRLLFVLIFRPGYKETGERIKRYVQETLPGHYRLIPLNPLEEKDSANLIRNLLKNSDLPPDITGLIIQRSEGNPFFIEEVIRSFIDDGLIEVQGGAFRMTDEIRYANIPETIDKVILSRIERLDEKTRSLLRTASVIGRNFYYKVLEEATQTIEELDNRLAYLKEAQLLNEDKHKEDVEFLFKHALAQQATYDSMMQSTRKELHLKIAKSIEKVFAGNIHAFYGVLAMHYSKAEVAEKVDEYLVKAGDEAFKSGASNEALHFYTEALKRLQYHKDDEQHAARYLDLEIKTAFAHQAAGNNIEATAFFNNIIPKFYHVRFPENPVRHRIFSFYNMARFIFKLYFHKLYFRKRPDTKFENYTRVLSQWGEAMTTLNPRRFFMESFTYLQHLADYDQRYSVHSLSLFTECANLFIWTGVSLRISQKILNHALASGVNDQAVSMINYRFTRKMQEYHTGKLDNEPDFDYVFNTAMQYGEFWPIIIYTVYCGYVNIERGDYAGLMNMVQKLGEIADSVENSHARAQVYRLSALGWLRFRVLNKVIESADEALDYTQKTGHFTALLIIWCVKASAHALQDELEEAKAAFQEATKLIPDKKIIPTYYIHYLQARAGNEMLELKNAMAKGIPYRKEAEILHKTVRLLIRLSASVPSSAIEAWRLMGLLQWMTGRQRKALRAFASSIKAGHQLNCRMELSRTCFETGRFLLDPGTRFSSLLGTSGSEYLLNAKAMMEELDLEWDLAACERYLEA
ncbi:MAG: AAA family ATPase [Lentimicrobiaceae bacterium]|nr:AAA family ATPase [Lentimicrobiaceae bacterium]